MYSRPPHNKHIASTLVVLICHIQRGILQDRMGHQSLDDCMGFTYSAYKYLADLRLKGYCHHEMTGGGGGELFLFHSESYYVHEWADDAIFE